MYIKYPHSLRRNAKLLSLTASCFVISFFVGVQTAGDVRPVSLIEAGSSVQAGDMNGDGQTDLSDVILLLEIERGYRQASPAQLKADPNRDGRLTVDDAIRLLSTLHRR